MNYLYGDSSPSPFRENYLALVRAAVDCCVELLLAEQSIRTRADRRGELRRAAQADVEQIEQLRDGAQRAVGPVAREPGNTPATSCANVMDRAIADAARDQIAAVNAALAVTLVDFDRDDERDRSHSFDALDAWLCDWDLPDATTSISLTAVDEGAYRGQVRQTTPYGIAFDATIAVPSDAPFAQCAAIGQFDGSLEVHVPEQSGWFRKVTRPAPRNLARLWIAQLEISATRVVLRARATPALADAGFDITVDLDSRDVELVEVAGPQQLPEPREVAPEDRASLLSLVDAVVEAATAVAGHRASLSAVTLDDEPIADYAAVVERIVAVLAPTVREIERRSSSANELVLRRALGDDRREELFLSENELVRALAPLPRQLRSAFDPLGFARGESEPEASEPEARQEPGDPPSDPSIVVYEHASSADTPPRPGSETGSE